MRIVILDPLYRAIVDGRMVEGERVKSKQFGGFCRCGGVMHQKLWLNLDGKRVLVSECEKCWRNEATLFEGKEVVGRVEVTVERVRCVG